MKTLTAIEFLKNKSIKRQLAEMQDLKDMLLLSAEGSLTETDFTIGWMKEADMMIDIRGQAAWIKIDGKFLIDWVEEFCNINESITCDKFLVINNVN